MWEWLYMGFDIYSWLFLLVSYQYNLNIQFNSEKELSCNQFANMMVLVVLFPPCLSMTLVNSETRLNPYKYWICLISVDSESYRFFLLLSGTPRVRIAPATRKTLENQGYLSFQCFSFLIFCTLYTSDLSLPVSC